MKTKLLTTILALSSALCALCQIPQGFNYQAIARDGSGNILQNTDLQVMLYIQSASTGGTIFWKELHNPVTTNNLGLFTIVVGQGVRQTGSQAATFDQIDWKVTPKYLKTEIYYSGSWKNMGEATQLYSVPYAMAAQNLMSTSKLDIKGTTSDTEESLFEVKNKDSQTIFAVYNEGVRMWVSDGNKGTKGGFVLGGFNGNNFLDVSIEATGIINPSQNRILWYPVKNAFLTGKVLVENPDSVGENSFTSGYESKAIGQYSQALGYKAIARGDYSTAIGKSAVADSINSFAFGDSARAMNNESYAIGRGAVASGYRSFAFGSAGIDTDGNKTDVTQALGDYSVAIGQGSRSYALGSLSIGLADTATGFYSTAVGYLSSAKGRFSTALGYITSSRAQYSTAIGVSVKAEGSWSTAMGYNSYSKGWASVAIGMAAEAIGDLGIAIGSSVAKGYNSVALAGSNIASGEFSLAVCNGSQAKGHSSASMGSGTIAKGYASVSLGKQTIASGYVSTSLGFNTISNSYGSFVIGRYNDTTNISSVVWEPSDPLFVCGNGSSYTARSNAFTVLKNGNIGIGNSTSPTARLEVNLANSSGWSGNLKALRVYSPDNAYYLDLNTSIITAGNTGYHFNPNGNTGLTISTPGYVGIGIANPGYHLDIYTGVLGTSLDSKLLMQKIDGLSGVTGNDDQLRIIMRRFVAGSGWGSSETRIQKTIDVTDMGYISFKADYLEFGGGYGGNTYMTLKNGNLGIGSTDPVYKLVVNGTAWCTSGAWTGSDIRWKKDIADLKSVLSHVLKLQPVSYQLRTEEFPGMGFERGDQVGLIAQDVEELFPALVKTDKDGYKAVAYDKLSAVLVEAIKEQQQQIESQQKQIDELKALVEKLMVKQEDCFAALAMTERGRDGERGRGRDREPDDRRQEPGRR